MKILGICSIVTCATIFQSRSVSAAVAFSSLNANDIFQSAAGAIVSGSQSSYGYYTVSYEFVPLVSGEVSSIDVSVGYLPGGHPDQFDVSLRANAGAGNYPTSSSLLSQTLATTFQFGSSITAFETLSPTNTVSIVAGTPYWLVVSPDSPNTADGWTDGLGQGDYAYSQNGGATWNSNTQTLGAFEVEVVPEPSVAFLVGIGFAVVLLRTNHRSIICLERMAAGAADVQNRALGARRHR